MFLTINFLRGAVLNRNLRVTTVKFIDRLRIEIKRDQIALFSTKAESLNIYTYPKNKIKLHSLAKMDVPPSTHGEGHSVAHLSENIIKAKQRERIYDKEFYAVVQRLCHLR